MNHQFQFLYTHRLIFIRCLNEHKLSWKVPYIFDGSGTLSATLMTNQSASDGSDSDQQPKPLTTSSIVHVQFLAENALFSSIDFEFACRGYRVSLLKKKIASGKKKSIFIIPVFHSHRFSSQVNTNQNQIKMNPCNSSNAHQQIRVVCLYQHPSWLNYFTQTQQKICAIFSVNS